MTTKKETLSFIIHILRLCVLLMLPFLLSLASLDNLSRKSSICLFKAIFGIECWGCGITKAVIAAIQLDFERAFLYNKLIVIVLPLMIYLWVKEIIKCVKNLHSGWVSLLFLSKGEGSDN